MSAVNVDLLRRCTGHALDKQARPSGLAIELRVGLVFVGDSHQTLPVGHAGAMASAARHANASVELDTVHRFRDPEYAALTLRLRDAGDREHALALPASWRKVVTSSGSITRTRRVSG